MGHRRGSEAGSSTGQFSASSIDLLIGNLAASDLIVTFFCNVTDVVWAVTIQWYAGNFACKLLKFLQVFGLNLSTYIVVVIAIDRCSAVLDPLSQRTTARHRSRILVGVSWLLSAILGLPQVRTDQTVTGNTGIDVERTPNCGPYFLSFQRYGDENSTNRRFYPDQSHSRVRSH